MLDFLKKNLQKSLNSFSQLKKNEDKISKTLLEEMLLEADLSYELVEELLYYLPPSDVVKKQDLLRVMRTYFLYDSLEVKQEKPFVELILGVNGAGKTTSIAKLAYLYKNQGQSVLLGACDTFRAGAIEQLKLWAQKLKLDIVANVAGSDPSAIAYDTIKKAQAKHYDRVLLDTAGRLENQKNLSKELEKIVRICTKALANAPHRKILILDGTQGNACLNQARVFHQAIKLDGLIITKLDGTAKGGALFSIAKELSLPILYIGTGEEAKDLISFNADEYLEILTQALFA